MPDREKKSPCYSCNRNFYAPGNPVPNSQKCGADQRVADEAPSVPASRSRARAVAAPLPVVEEAADEEFGAEGEVTPPAGDEDEEIIPEADRDEEPADEEEDEDY